MANAVVCSMNVNEPRAARKSAYESRSYYCCSTGCQQRFKADSARYRDARRAYQRATHQLTGSSVPVAYGCARARAVAIVTPKNHRITAA
jgi:YHS domain-containing protein